eukprot:scaffold117647_cov32-Tisochrysis_lutea.AAC.1
MEVPVGGHRVVHELRSVGCQGVTLGRALEAPAICRVAALGKLTRNVYITRTRMNGTSVVISSSSSGSGGRRKPVRLGWARTSCAIAERVSRLNHEALDDAVEDDAIVVAVACVRHKVLHRLRALVWKQLEVDLRNRGPEWCGRLAERPGGQADVCAPRRRTY